MTHNTREGIEEVHPWWEKLKIALSKQDKYHYCKVDATDLEFAIEHYYRIHQELQKAKQEAKIEILKDIAFYAPIYTPEKDGEYQRGRVDGWEDLRFFAYKEFLNNTELDQDNK